MTGEEVKFAWDDPPITYLVDYTGETVFTKHPIWGHKLNYYLASEYEETFLINGNEVTYETNHLQIRIDRLGRGILMRFALPILILVILAGLTVSETALVLCHGLYRLISHHGPFIT